MNYSSLFNLLYSTEISEATKAEIINKIQEPVLESCEAEPLIETYMELLDTLVYSTASESLIYDIIDEAFSQLSEEAINEVSDEWIKRKVQDSMTARRNAADAANRSVKSGIVGLSQLRKQDHAQANLEKGQEKASRIMNKAAARTPQATSTPKPEGVMGKLKSAVGKVKSWLGGGSKDTDYVGLSRAIARKANKDNIGAETLRQQTTHKVKATSSPDEVKAGATVNAGSKPAGVKTKAKDSAGSKPAGVKAGGSKGKSFEEIRKSAEEAVKFGNRVRAAAKRDMKKWDDEKEAREEAERQKAKDNLEAFKKNSERINNREKETTGVESTSTPEPSNAKGGSKGGSKNNGEKTNSKTSSGSKGGGSKKGGEKTTKVEETPADSVQQTLNFEAPTEEATPEPVGTEKKIPKNGSKRGGSKGGSKKGVEKTTKVEETPAEPVNAEEKTPEPVSTEEKTPEASEKKKRRGRINLVQDSAEARKRSAAANNEVNSGSSAESETPKESEEQSTSKAANSTSTKAATNIAGSNSSTTPKSNEGTGTREVKGGLYGARVTEQKIKELERALETRQSRLAQAQRPGGDQKVAEAEQAAIENIKKRLDELRGNKVNEALSDLALLLLNTNISESCYVEVMEMVAASRVNAQKALRRDEQNAMAVIDDINKDLEAGKPVDPEKVKKAEELRKKKEQFEGIFNRKFNNNP